MLARSHALSGVVGWIGLCAAAPTVGVQPQTNLVITGGIVAAGAAILPDIDCPGSTVARSLGPVTGVLARLTSVGAGWLRDRTCSHCRGSDGHRSLTHTVVFALVLGGAVCVAGWLWGLPVGAVVAGVLGALGVRGLIRRNAGLAAAAGALCAGAVLCLPELSAWWWLGVPVTVGVLLHILGDAATHSGVPMLWPLRVRGCRWRRLGSPRWMRFRTGGVAEQVLWWLMLLGAVALWMLI